jgi:4-alpha-glucanotransferase
MTADLGCDVLGLNPFRQMFPDKPEHAGPFSPASRSFLNILYIDVKYAFSSPSSVLSTGASESYS